MKRSLTVLLAVLLAAALAFAGGQAPAKKLKVFISVDMEGVAGLIHWDETSEGGADYGLFRRLMTEEANAAVAGALDAGASEIVVRDAHGSARNILPDLLRPEARLIREWNSPLSMMEGIDKTFDAVVFVGNHARAGTPNAVLKHTMSLSLFDVILNGVRLPEAAWNAAIAGYFDVPVVFLSGDSAVCKQIQEIIGPIETAAVKDAMGPAASMLHPSKAQDMIRKGVTAALRNLKAYKPYKPSAPYKLEIVFTDENLARRASYVPGADRTGERSVAFTAADFMDIVKVFRLARL
ncbi:MAG: M55 family metallopeptidase [Candidatus Aminicenantes bacterium]|nr:M55 family metallopeptidase [Candidatus Aminicenantes bacterium]NLH76697.1 M55 family metallopeptidase [Acidobacteriota bacterium]